MPTISRDKVKKKGFKRFLNSFRYSVEGLVYAYKNEQSFLIHFIASFTAVALGLILGIDAGEWFIVILILAIVLIVELFNTAIEAIVDMITLEQNMLAKIAKDCGSAAAFVASVIGIGICLSIYVPYVIALLN